MIKNDITEVVILENTRPLYTAVENLHRNFLATLDDQALDVAERLRKLEGFLKSPGLLQGGNNHPCTAFLGFLSSESDDAAQTARDLLRLYDALYYLSIESLDRVQYPDAFEQLCNCMRRNMDSKVCYLLYSQRNHIELLSTSVFPDTMVIGADKPDVPTQLTLNDFNEIRRHIHRVRALKSNDQDEHTWSIADTIYHPKVGDHQLLVMVIDFPRYPRDSWKDEYIYIIFQRATPFPAYAPKPAESTGVDDAAWKNWHRLICQCRNVLFLRNHILEQCMRKLYVLMSSQRSYQYVKRLAPKGTPLRILHLTDLHITENLQPQMKKFLDILEERKVRAAKSAEKMKAQNEKNGNTAGAKPDAETVDLIVITGDVIQASSSAGIMEERYRLAARFIREVAAKLWSEEHLVRTDWRKRIIIVPGNHDYATMNELQSMSLPGELRSTGLGYPARKDGGPMVKFAYYINFLCDLLGMDINEMVANDLNEARRYQQMGLTVYGINTVSEIGPLRNNKVSIKLDAVRGLIKTPEARNRFNLILSHHSPFYKPDYLMDRYGVWDMGIPEDRQRGWITEFSAAMDRFDSSQKGETDQQDYRDSLIGLRKKIVEEMEKNNQPVENSSYDLLWDISGAIRSLEEYTGFSERLSLLHHTISRERQMMARDEHLLQEAFRELMRQIGFHLCLSGHTHRFDYHLDTDFFRELDKTEILCVEGDRMFSGDRITYGIVEVSLDKPRKRRVQWNGYTDKNFAIQRACKSTF